MDDNLVGYWKLDDRNGATDLSGNGNDGTGEGGISIGGAVGQSGLAGGATAFDGSNDYITIPTSDEISGFTNVSWSFWVNRDSNPISTQGIITKYATINNQRGYTITNGVNENDTDLSMSFSDEGETYERINTDSGFFTNDEWIHCVVVYDEGDISVYKNGELFDTLVSAKKSIFKNDANMEIGVYQISGSYFDGDIADVRIYNRIVRAEEIRQIYSITRRAYSPFARMYNI